MIRLAGIALTVLMFPAFLRSAPLPTGDGHSVEMFGPILPAVSELGVGPGMAVDVQGELAYFIGEGALRVIDISKPENPQIVGSLANLGTTRQIQVREGIAYIVSRGDGLYIVDVSDPTQPQLLSNYDSIEFATGLALGGDLAFLACRLYGVELVDIADPRKPKHISVSRTGVSQSVVYANGFIYVGVWAEQAVVAVDVQNPWNPTITDRIQLDGYGDGVAVYQGHLYAATGQHSRAKPDDNPGDPGFGAGHGLEIFSLADPARPRLVSRRKFPQDNHTDSHLWAVRVSNGHAFVVDNYNGLFVLDVSDPSRPRPVGQHQLPYFEPRKGAAVMSGLAVADDRILVTSPYRDARIVAAPGIAGPIPDWTGKAVSVGPRPIVEQGSPYEAHYLGGQAHSLTTVGDTAYIAAGQGGLYVTKVWPKFQRLHHYPTEDLVLDVKSKGNTMLVAEGTRGLRIYETVPDGQLFPVGWYDTQGEAAKQVVAPSGSDFAVLMVGPHSIHIVDISDPSNPVNVFREYGQGILTGDNIVNGLFEGRYAGVYWHKSGHFHKPTDRIRWYDLQKDEGPAFVHQTTLGRIKTANGIDVIGDRLLVLANGGYRYIDYLESAVLQSIRLNKIPSLPVIGKPTVYEDKLIVSHRAGGEIWILDIGRAAEPRLATQLQTRANPARALALRDRLLIPGGYEGLLIYDLSQ